MTSEQIDEDPLTRTGVLRAHFGESYKFWIWMRNQFTPVSLGTIAVILTGTGGYIGHLRETVSSVTTRVVVLETRVVPVIEQSSKMAEQSALIASLTAQGNETQRRLGKLEDKWENASTVAGTPNDKLLHQKRRPR